MKFAAREKFPTNLTREFDRSLPMMLYRALEAVLPPFRLIFAQFDLTETQWRVLRALWEKDGRAFSELARITLIPSPSLVGVVDRLTRDGLVTRQPSDRDRRHVHVCLTAQGSTLRARIEPLVNAAYDELESCLTSQQWRGLYEAIDQLCRQKAAKNGGEVTAHAQHRRKQHKVRIPPTPTSRQNGRGRTPSIAHIAARANS